MGIFIQIFIAFFLTHTFASELSLNHEITIAYQQKESLDSAVNSNNSTLEIPFQTGIITYSPQLKYDNQNDLKVVLRGVAEFQNQTIEKNKGTQKTNKSTDKYDLTDAYLEISHSQNFKSVLGLQVYQWGPAELISPSNFIFHLDNQQKSFLAKDKGHGLIRLNWTLEDLNIVLLSEVQSQNQAPWMADEAFEPSHLVKFEKLFSGGQNFLGMTLGKHRNNGSAVGGYGVYRISDQWSLYFDGVVEDGSQYYIPEQNGFGFYEMKISQNQNKELLDLGFRSENIWDLRFEYIYNANGWTAEQLSQGLRSVTEISPSILSNAKRFAKPGLELLEKEYLYISMRIPDLGKKKDIQAYLRALKSLKSSGITYQLSFDQVINDSIVAYGELIQKSGEINQAMTLADRYSLSIGFRWVN